MEKPTEKKRIWELDALRGLFLLCMMGFHIAFDLTSFADVPIQMPAFLHFVQDYGGTLFILLSGICATLGTKSAKRGAVVFGCAMLITAVTAVLARLGFCGDDFVVRFGILHLLGVSMLLYPLVRRWKTLPLCLLGAALVALGFYVETLRVQVSFLFPLGLVTDRFASGDYFPLLPNFGWFLLGVCLGRTLYREKRSLLPRFPSSCAPVRALRFCGRYSLQLYLLHQPVFILLIAGAAALLR